jgi:ABC-type oligopeptide transport system ATPase subunit
MTEPNTTGLGIVGARFRKKNVKQMNKTEKYLIIGASGSGKTTFACNMLYYHVKPFCGIVVISPHKNENDQNASETEAEVVDDISISTLQYNCEKAKMPIYRKTFEEFGTIPDIEDSSVWIIDDYYTSTGRNKDLEVFLKQLVNNGRHTGKHVIYCAHNVKYLPHEIKDNNTGIFLSEEVASKESVYKSLGLDIPKNIPEFKNEHNFYKVGKNGYLDLVTFSEPKFKSNIPQKLENKVPQKIREERARQKQKIIDDNAKKDLKMSAELGNKEAAKKIGKGRLSIFEMIASRDL